MVQGFEARGKKGAGCRRRVKAEATALHGQSDCCATDGLAQQKSHGVCFTPDSKHARQPTLNHQFDGIAIEILVNSCASLAEVERIRSRVCCLCRVSNGRIE